jgi:hypothetical protein
MEGWNLNDFYEAVAVMGKGLAAQKSKGKKNFSQITK